MKPRLQDALEVCLAARQAGATREACLALFPDLAPELRPLLDTAQAASLPPLAKIPDQAWRRSQRRIAERAQSLRASGQHAGLGRGRWALALAGVALVLLTSGAALALAQRALPGDSLYPIKRLAENLRLNLTSGTQARQRLQGDYDRTRLSEVESLAETGRETRVAFEGIVLSQTATSWRVQRFDVVISPDTRGVGGIRVGNTVLVTGQTRADGRILAHEILLREYDIAGDVESILAGLWRVGGRTFRVDAQTEIPEPVSLGDQVLVRLRFGDDGVVFARRIRLLTPYATPAPRGQDPTSAVPSPVASPTPGPVNPTQETDALESEGEGDDEEVHLDGIVQSIAAGIWVVDGQALAVDEETEIEGHIGVGDPVRVEAIRLADGQLRARHIELRP